MLTLGALTYSCCPIRDARLKMCPDSCEEESFISERILGNEPKVVYDEYVSGDYGLVINGHSLVRHTRV